MTQDAAQTAFSALTARLEELGIACRDTDTGRRGRVTVPWRTAWRIEHPVSTEADVDGAVAAASAALPAWRESEEDRRDALRALGRAVAEHADLFRTIISFENGKLSGPAEREVAGARGVLEHYAGLPLEEEVLRSDARETITLIREPIGVVAAITPANMPLMMLVTKVAAALLVGNVVVAKPSPYTPLTALLLGRLAADVLPAGVLSIVAGDAAVGRRLTEHPEVGMISFTGSRGVGKAIMASAAGTLKRVQLELGGNDPAILLRGADLDTVVPTVFQTAFMSSGQACVAVKRLYVPEEYADEVVDRLVALAARTVVGTPFDEGATHPAVGNGEQYRKVSAMLDEAIAAGARVRTGGLGPDDGLFIRPTVLTDVADGMEIVDEEQFGPVLPVIPYREVAEVVRAVNAGPYGLGATVWSSDVGEATRVARALTAGQVWVNSPPAPDPTIPFGGAKESGLGREGGSIGLDAFCEIKVLKVPAPIA